jgi:hypothetical protein
MAELELQIHPLSSTSPIHCRPGGAVLAMHWLASIGIQRGFNHPFLTVFFRRPTIWSVPDLRVHVRRSPLCEVERTFTKCIATSQFDPEQTIFAKPIDATDLN